MMTNYNPIKIKIPTINVVSAWGDIPYILTSIVNDFGVNIFKALEFGCEYGYSTAALAELFDEVTAVDTFDGDIHSGVRQSFINQTKQNLDEYSNIELIQSDFEDYIIDCNELYDIIHIDIIHTYIPTYKCAEWAINHSKCVILHDTESFPEIKQVCKDLSKKYNLDFYNYSESNGLGILIYNNLK